MRGWFIIFDEFAEIRQSMLNFAVKAQADVARPIPPWMQELHQIPRRMKRPFPANKPFNPPVFRRARY